jgi:hypothetical protein
MLARALRRGARDCTRARGYGLERGYHLALAAIPAMHQKVLDDEIRNKLEEAWSVSQ